ncbi:hypothetical protein ACQPZ8_00560 [Actinomadura nitritigenes]|uniref:hypothetical protein n=1 Tax=Actinomadura nitritigenes TaxID=134602 RepID=UPI003D949828
MRTVPLTQAVSTTAAPPPDGVFPDGPGATAPDGAPVFVDATGRRHRLARRIGLLAGALLVVFLGALGIGAATGAAVPGTPWNAPSAHPGVGGHQPASARAGKSGAVAEPGGASPSRRPRTVPSGASPKAPSATSKPVTTATPSASSAPSAKPSATTSTSRPGNSHASPPAWGHTKKPA